MVANTTKVQEHYDVLSPFYQKFWGKHIHHGYWVTGDESREVATENLIKLVVEKAQLAPRSKVLDIGCGVGGTSMWLAQQLQCTVTGITISPVQVQMATDNAASLPRKPRFLVMDANQLKFNESFDAIVALEMISHLANREAFFQRTARLLNPGGKLCLMDWMKDASITEKDERKYIDPIEEGMLVTLSTPNDYLRYIEKTGMRVLYMEDISDEVKRTWDLCLDLLRDKTFWSFAAQRGGEFLAFLRAFKAMRAGFASGTFRYIAIVAEKR